MKSVKILGRFAWLAFFLCLPVSSGFAQKTVNGDFKSDANLNLFLLSISDSTLRFKQGDKLQIEITLKNKTKEEIFFLRGNEIDDFFVEIKDEKGKIVSYSEEGKLRNELPKTGSRYLVELKSNDEYKFVLDLSNLYDLKTGKYTISVSRGMYKKDKKTEFYAKSRPRKIIIG
jgi:hypothetical protein